MASVELRRSTQQRPDGLALFMYAAAATRSKSPRAVAECNVRLGRARDMMARAPAADVVGAFALTAEEFEAERAPALAMLRRTCAACGLCARHGLAPP